MPACHPGLDPGSGIIWTVMKNKHKIEGNLCIITLKRGEKFARISHMQIVNATRRNILAPEVREARSFLGRLTGWVKHTDPRPGQGLYLTPCRGVHSLGLRFAIDAVYITNDGSVQEIYTLLPWRIGPCKLHCRGVLELPAGTCEIMSCQKGDQLEQINGKGW